MVSCRCRQYINHSFKQFEKIKGVILLFGVTVCTTTSIENINKTRELSEEVRHKIADKHGQSQGHKSISSDLDVPVSTVHNVIRKFKAHGTLANLHGRLDVAARENLIEDCSEGLFDWKRKTSINCQTDSN